MDITTARVEVLSIASQAIARALTPSQASQAAGEVRDAVARLIAEVGSEVTPELDEEIAVQAHAVLEALRL